MEICVPLLLSHRPFASQGCEAGVEQLPWSLISLVLGEEEPEEALVGTEEGASPDVGQVADPSWPNSPLFCSDLVTSSALGTDSRCTAPAASAVTLRWPVISSRHHHPLEKRVPQVYMQPVGRCLAISFSLLLHLETKGY